MIEIAGGMKRVSHAEKNEEEYNQINTMRACMKPFLALILNSNDCLSLL